jgi:hypothetical protein
MNLVPMVIGGRIRHSVGLHFQNRQKERNPQFFNGFSRKHQQSIHPKNHSSPELASKHFCQKKFHPVALLPIHC